MKAWNCARCRKRHTHGVFTGPLGPQCPQCLAFLEHEAHELWSMVFDFGVIVGVGLAIALVCLLLSGSAGAR